MYVVIFEIIIPDHKLSEYLSFAQKLLPLAHATGGMISVERFKSINTAGKIVSLSYWEDEQSILTWRNNAEHRIAQAAGRRSIFINYQISVAHIVRQYEMHHRQGAPEDSDILP